MRRSGISVMFMTFIAVSILTLIFVSYYLYLTQHNLSASEAQRIYAEAAQESLEIILDRRAGELLINNTGGIGVVIKYLACLDRSGNTANIHELDQPWVIPVGGKHQHLIPDGFSCSSPGEIYVMTERGNLFKAVPGGYRFELEAKPSNITLGEGSSTVVTLKLKATLLETPEHGTILIVGDLDECRMTTTTTRIQIINITYTTTTVVVGRTVRVATICTYIFIGCGGWTTITYVADPTSLTVVTSVSARFTTETVTRSEKWVRAPGPITTTFNTRARTTVTIPVTISAQQLPFWNAGSECFLWFKVLNATSGSKLAEAGVKAVAVTP